jgi:hypothetical protein
VSLTYNPYGLIPSAHESGTIRPAFGSGGGQPYGGYTIASGYANNIFHGAPIGIDVVTPTSNIVLVAAQGASLASGSITNAMKFLGAFQGVEFTLSTGRRTVSPFWPAGTVPFAGSPTVAWITRDPRLRYEIQANGPVAATPTATVPSMGSLCSFTANGSANGSAVTGFSTVGLDTTTANMSNPLNNPTFLNQLRIVGFSQRIDNNPGDAFTQVVVEIALHQDLPLPGAPY